MGPKSRSEMSVKKYQYLLTLKDGTDRLSRNVGINYYYLLTV